MSPVSSELPAVSLATEVSSAPTLVAVPVPVSTVPVDAPVSVSWSVSPSVLPSVVVGTSPTLLEGASQAVRRAKDTSSGLQ